MMRTITVILVVYGLVFPPTVGFSRALDLQRGQSTEETEEDEAGRLLWEDVERERLPFLEGPVDPNTYVLGPSDELILILKGAETTLHSLRVFPEGNVILPNVGAFPASGITLAEFRDRVRSGLGRYYRNVEIDCQLSRPRRFVVFVLGQVGTPRPVQMAAPFRVSHAIGGAGGIKKSGSRRQIEIRENGEAVRSVDLFAFFQLGDFDENPFLSEGQTVFVPAKQKSVQIVGEVRLPGTYEILPGETVADLLAYCGGIGPNGDHDHLLLERMKAGKALPPREFSIKSAASVQLEDMDLIVVRDIMSFGGDDPVEVFGGGGRTGAIRIVEAEPLSEFMRRLWRFQPNFDIETAVLERNSSGSTPQHIQFNVRDVLSGGKDGDILVQRGDLVIIPGREGKVYVAGEVQSPGGVPFEPGLTVARYIALAGGPTSAGGFGKLTVFSRDGVERKADRSSPVYRGDTIVVKQRTSKTLGSIFVGLTSLTGLILSVVALSR